MKKILLTICIFALSLTLFGCSKTNEDATADDIINALSNQIEVQKVDEMDESEINEISEENEAEETTEVVNE